jgi:hypothetical protein
MGYNIAITILDIIRRPVFYLKQGISETYSGDPNIKSYSLFLEFFIGLI